MAYYAPFGNNQNEVIDPDELAREWQEARRIASSMTHWQMCTENTGNRFDSRVIKNGSSVIVHQKGKTGRCGHGHQRGVVPHPNHCDALMLWPHRHREKRCAWLVPYLKGYQEVFGGDCAITWKSTYPELVLFSMSWRTYRLSSLDWVTEGYARHTDYFPNKVRPRIKLTLNLDGECLAGCGPGMNTPTDKYNILRGQGMFYKTEKSTSTFVKLVPAGNHRASPVAGQFSAQYHDREKLKKVNQIEYFPGGVSDDTFGHGSPEGGVSIPNCRFTVIRFPRGTMLGG